MYFGFRITVCADGTEVVDRKQGIFCCLLTPLQMAEYLEMDKQLAVMDRMERKEKRKRKLLIGNPIYKIVCLCGMV